MPVQVREFVLGPHSTLDLLAPVGGIDLQTVLNFSMRPSLGLTAEQIIRMAAAAMGTANAEIINRYGGLMHMTDQPMVMYGSGNGSGRKTPQRAEFAQNNAVRSGESGHMLPLNYFSDALAWSQEYLEDAYLGQLESDIQVIVDSWWAQFRYQMWYRALINTDIAFLSGFNAGWARYDGSVPYVPPAQQGVAPSATHTHFLWIDGVSAAVKKTLATNMLATLREHGLKGRAYMVVSSADIEGWTAVSGFVELKPDAVTIIAGPGGSAERIQYASGNLEGVPGELFGYLNTIWGLIELHYDETIPTGYCFMTVPYGVNNPKNGLALRRRTGTDFGLRPDLKVTNHLNPRMEQLDFEGNFGVGVANRLNGVAGYFATSASAYVNPTIS